MHFTTPTLLAALGSALIPHVQAHGYVQGIVANGKWHTGYTPWWFTYEGSYVPPKSAGWGSLNQDYGYVSPSSYGNSDIACGKSAAAGDLFIPVAAGSKVDLQWTEWPAGHYGPVLTYMARCPGDCTNVKQNDLEFFKINHKGMTSSGQAPGSWASQELIANNNTWTVTIPKNLKPGGYVLRHELIALHSAENENGAQNYPQCINLKVTGTGNAEPAGIKATELYKYQGAGIKVNIWYPALTSYRIPGPAVWKGAVKRWYERSFVA